MQKLLEAIGGYGVQCSETKELSPPQYLLDAIDEQDKQLAAQQQQIAVYREAMLSVLCDPEGSPCFEGSDGDREVIRQALAQPFDTSA